MTTPSTEPRFTYPEKFQAIIKGRVQHRVGDGPLEDIPVGQEVEVATAIASLVLSWESEGQPITVTLAKDEFDLYVSQGDIEVQGASATTAAASA